MRRPRFTIASLLGVVVFVAVASAALREATEFWDGGVFGLALVTLITGVLLAVHQRDQKRAFWLGFAFFGWVYLVASLVPPVESRLLTTKGLAYIASKVPRTPPMGVALADFDNDGQIDLFVANASAPDALFRNQGNGTFRDVTPVQPAVNNGKPFSGGVIVWNSSTTWKSLLGSDGTAENFVRIGHSVLALVMALFGGCLSRWLYVRRAVTTPEVSPPPPNGIE
jgi:hypothetical protein